MLSFFIPPSRILARGWAACRTVDIEGETPAPVLL